MLPAMPWVLNTVGKFMLAQQAFQVTAYANKCASFRGLYIYTFFEHLQGLGHAMKPYDLQKQDAKSNARRAALGSHDCRHLYLCAADLWKQSRRPSAEAR